MKFWKWLKEQFASFRKIKESIDYTKPSAFKHTWSVVEFAKLHGKMQLGKYPEYNNRESHQVCRFIGADGSYTYVIVSSRMQYITISEIEKQKDRIKVGQLYNGKYVLFDFRWKPWEDVELGL